MAVASQSHTEVQVRELSPDCAVQRDAWRQYVAGRPDATVFHTLGWLDAISATYAHRARYLMAECREAVVGVFPLFEVRSLLAGTILVSVPHGIYGGVLCNEQGVADVLLDAARQLSRSAGARYIDVRSRVPRWPTLQTVNRYVTFERELPASSDEVIQGVPRKARAEIRKARDRFGLQMQSGSEHLPVVWELYSRSMRRLGSPNVPQRLFQELINALPGAHDVSVVRHGGQPIAGVLSFVHSDTFMPYFSGCEEGPAGRMGANNYMYAGLMEQAVRMGLKRFDFGRTRVDNKGSYEFKRNQGFEARPLGYQFDVREGAAIPNLTPSNPKFDLARRVWRRLPLVLTRPLGSWLSTSIPG